jgi:hypothetical protein
MSRALRRHHRRRILARRRWIATVVNWHPEHLDVPPQVRHWHFRCKCFECPADGRADRRRAEREWRQMEERAW